MSDQDFLVRDRREAGHFWADNEVLDVFGTQLGEHGFAAYMVLCRHATNGTGECRLSTRKLAKLLGMSAGGAFNALATVLQVGLARQIHPGDRSSPAVYSLVDVKALLNPEMAQLKLAGRGAHTVSTDELGAHDVSTGAHPVSAGAHGMSGVLTTRARNKEVKTFTRLKTKTKNNTPSGALRDWLAIKTEIQALIPSEEFRLWLRPMYLLKVLDGEGLLLSVPANDRIMQAANANRPLIRKHAQARGYGGIALTRYPDDYQRERIRNEFPDFYEQMLGNKEATA